MKEGELSVGPPIKRVTLSDGTEILVTGDHVVLPPPLDVTQSGEEAATARDMHRDELENGFRKEVLDKFLERVPEDEK